MSTKVETKSTNSISRKVEGAFRAFNPSSNQSQSQWYLFTTFKQIYHSISHMWIIFKHTRIHSQPHNSVKYLYPLQHLNDQKGAIQFVPVCHNLKKQGRIHHIKFCCKQNWRPFLFHPSYFSPQASADSTQQIQAQTQWCLTQRFR